MSKSRRSPGEAPPPLAGQGDRSGPQGEVGKSGISLFNLPEDGNIESQAVERPFQLLVLSAQVASALDASSEALGRHLVQHRDCDLADVAYTLQAGCKGYPLRRALVCRSSQEAARSLIRHDPQRILTGTSTSAPPKVTYLFPGLGNHYLGMAAQAYRCEPVYRHHLDLCAQTLQPHLGLDFRSLLHSQRALSQKSPGSGLDLRALLKGEWRNAQDGQGLIQTRLAQPILFCVEYALSRQWMHWGIQPQSMIGYSLGEYVAACLAGVFSLQDALQLVARRAQMIDALPQGSMLAVPLSESQVKPFLGDHLSLAAVNGPSASVVAGPPDAVSELEGQLAQDGIACRRLVARHAFHSKMMEPIRQPFARLVEQMRPQPPQIPFLSNLTGDWITPEQATDPEYWASHLCHTVRFADGVSCLLQEENRALLEVGPGQALGAWALQAPSQPADLLVASSLPHLYDHQPDLAVLLNALGKLWLAGAEVDWEGFCGSRRRRVPLPNLVFEGLQEPRDALAGSGLAERTRVPDAQPRTELERKLRIIWQGLLGSGQIGIYDKFFEIGGDSLKAARLSFRLEEEFGIALSLRKLFQFPTIAELSVAVVQEQAAQLDSDLLAQAMAEIHDGWQPAGSPPPEFSPLAAQEEDSA